jgi:hypothetical protein
VRNVVSLAAFRARRAKALRLATTLRAEGHKLTVHGLSLALPPRAAHGLAAAIHEVLGARDCSAGGGFVVRPSGRQFEIDGTYWDLPVCHLTRGEVVALASELVTEVER